LCCGGLVPCIFGRLFPSTWRWLYARRSFAGAECSAPTADKEADKSGHDQHNDADDHPQSCRIHRLILGEEPDGLA
jgi:hypothetical protein